MEENIIFEKTDFDYTNPQAEIVIVGITPGNSQLVNSREGKNLKEIKKENAFGGNMRPNLIRMLNHVGINQLLRISSCQSLWGDDFDRVEMTSLLKEATYILDKNGGKSMFKDTKYINKSEKLSSMLKKGFVADCTHYNNAKVFVALGPGVYDELQKLKEQNIIKVPIIGMAHPSGANSGRIACYLGTKEPKDLSYQWCIDKAKEAQQIISLLLK